MKVYPSDWPEAMVREAFDFDRYGYDCKTVEDAIWVLEEAHEDARRCIAACDRALAELKAGNADWFTEILQDREDLVQELADAGGTGR